MNKLNEDDLHADREMIREQVEARCAPLKPDAFGEVDTEAGTTAHYKELAKVPRDQLEGRVIAALQVCYEFDKAADDRGEQLDAEDGEISRRRNTDTELARLRLLSHWLENVCERFLKRKLPVSKPLLDAALVGYSTGVWEYFAKYEIIGFLLDYCADQPLPEDWRDAVKALIDGSEWDAESAKRRQQIADLKALLRDDSSLSLKAGDANTDRVLAFVKDLRKNERKPWVDLVNAIKTVSNKPSKKWRKQVDGLMDAIGEEQVKPRLRDWLHAIGEPGSKARDLWYTGFVSPVVMDESNHDLGCGTVWAASRYGELAPAIGRAAVAGYKKLHQGIVLSERIGGAAVRALGLMEDRRAVEELARLEFTIRTPKAKKVIAKTLAAAAEREGLTTDQLSETAAPTLGLKDGVSSVAFDEATAEVTLQGEKARIAWRMPDGKTRKAIPKEVKQDHPDARDDVKALASQLETAVTAQRRRIERLMRSDRRWPADTWRELYLDHPLVGLIARKLIWEVGDTACIWHDNAMRDRDGQPVTLDGEVGLWHPIGREIDDVTRWRELLEAWAITQPFKQAHREVYLLTDAEVNTGVYSNRYAAHILKSAALVALSQTRGWVTGLFGGESSPRVDLPFYGVRAEYWVDPASDDYTDFGSPKYLATDRVRYYASSKETAERLGHAEAIDQPLSLELVPPRAFSEVMRDVDMFVGITSVGNDPEWSDGGPQGRWRDYWSQVSFGELTASAKTRQAVLERLVPRLKIADRCELRDRFLVVRGDVRAYKIHLGSGNILMEPNDAYLCIVPGRGAAGSGTDGIFLPFEGDRTLSIILSKAFMLAEDTKITDTTILSQIR